MEDSKSSIVDGQVNLKLSHSISPPRSSEIQDLNQSVPNFNDDDDDDDDQGELSSTASPSGDMAALVARNNLSILPASAGLAGVNKRYRPAPAKTFQCRGYGECRMVFSRSEHLARHIRKHTGERPFTCHCSKQFSRLDNLRQHAQTVHADKQDQNERMMRELTSLHASMAAANKSGHTRGKRSQAILNNATTPNTLTPSQDGSMHGIDQVKEEELSSSLLPMHQRPGTSTGYEGGDNMIYGDGWNSDLDRAANSRSRENHHNHSFRDSSQSFRVPPASSTSWHQHAQSFQAFSTNTFNFSIPSRDSLSLSRDGRPGSSSTRPPTAASTDAHARTLPPLAAVVSATIPPPPSQSFSIQSQSAQHVLPLPFRRPSTANRPGTAPASILAAKPAYAGGPGLVTELSFPIYGRGNDMAAPSLTSSYSCNQYDTEPASPTSVSYESPFSFHPPALSESISSSGPFTYSPPGNPRKRPYPGPDDDVSRRELSNGLSGHGEYEYGSESRPQSRRLTVLELCNDPDADAGVRQFLPSSTAGAVSRPTTASGLVSSASALALVDRTPISSYSLLPGTQTPTVATTSAATYGAGAGTATIGGGRLSPQYRHDLSSSSSTAAGAGTILSSHRGSFAPSPLSDAASRSPRSPHGVVAFTTTVARSVSIHSNASSSSSSSSSHGTSPPTSSLSRRRGESPVVASAYSSAAVGMKV